jgi:putative toxin-antitoxin system antitoxin component (TIGR02293 family)
MGTTTRTRTYRTAAARSGGKPVESYLPAPLYIRLGFIKKDLTELVEVLRAGASPRVFFNLAVELSTSQRELGKLIGLSPATLARRRRSKRLSREESNRAYRLACAYQKSLQLFEGDRDAAVRWLKEPAKALGGSSPLDYLDTEAGADAVRDLIGRLEYGVIT